MLGFVAKKYLLPFLTVGRRQRYAEYIAKIADEIISDLRTRYPDQEWLKHLDEAVELLVEITEISPEVGRRAIRAAVQR
jgi:hypothetical protein